MTHHHLVLCKFFHIIALDFIMLIKWRCTRQICVLLIDIVRDIVLVRIQFYRIFRDVQRNSGPEAAVSQAGRVLKVNKKIQEEIVLQNLRPEIWSAFGGVLLQFKEQRTASCLCTGDLENWLGHSGERWLSAVSCSSESNERQKGWARSWHCSQSTWSGIMEEGGICSKWWFWWQDHCCQTAALKYKRKMGLHLHCISLLPCWKLWPR